MNNILEFLCQNPENCLSHFLWHEINISLLIILIPKSLSNPCFLLYLHYYCSYSNLIIFLWILQQTHYCLLSLPSINLFFTEIIPEVQISSCHSSTHIFWVVPVRYEKRLKFLGVVDNIAFYNMRCLSLLCFSTKKMKTYLKNIKWLIFLHASSAFYLHFLKL